MELAGATAIVTGSTGQVGSVIALRLGRMGCNCVCQYKNNKVKAEELIKQIESSGVKAKAVQADLAMAENIERLFVESQEWGISRVLVNCAAVFYKQRLEETSYAEAQRVLGLNLLTALMTGKEFAGLLRKNTVEAGKVVGKIVNISDVGGIRPWAEYVTYCTSKAGLNGATKALAKELAPSILVNAVAPGVIGWPEDFGPAEKERQLSFIPMRRAGTAEEVAAAVEFLIRNDYITGQILNIDGGRCI